MAAITGRCLDSSVDPWFSEGTGVGSREQTVPGSLYINQLPDNLSPPAAIEVIQRSTQVKLAAVDIVAGSLLYRRLAYRWPATQFHRNAQLTTIQFLSNASLIWIS